MSRSKYNAKPTVAEGIRFASQKEGRRYAELRLLEHAGEIRDLRVQPRFPLWAHTGVVSDDPIKIGEYRGDFAYEDRKGQTVVEDVKGFKTPLYKWKRKHVMAQYGITISEI